MAEGLKAPSKWEHLKHLAALVAAIAGLITAIGAYFRPETSARKTYDALAQELERQSKDMQKMHDDIVAINSVVRPKASSPLFTLSGDGLEKFSSVLPEIDDAGVDAGLLSSSPATASEKPIVHAKPKLFTPPPYKSVTGKDDL